MFQEPAFKVLIMLWSPLRHFVHFHLQSTSQSLAKLPKYYLAKKPLPENKNRDAYGDLGNQI